jgi:hypothetical protein
MKAAWFGTAAAWLALAAWAPPAPAQGVTTYHNSNDRHGAYVVPGLTAAAAAGMHVDPNFHASVSGDVYAQPLVWQPAGGGAARLIVATTANVVQALDAVTGAAVWSTSLPPAVPLRQLPCGNIDPMGTVGTPVIDPASGTLYVASQTLQNGAPRQIVTAIALADGSIRPGWPLDVQAALAAQGTSFDSSVQGQRSALLLFRNRVFVFYGGMAGDCGSYHGVAIQIDPARAALTASWQTTARGGGIWAQGGGAGDDNSVYVTTGNTFGASQWSDGEAIIRLRPGVQPPASTADYYVPSNWKRLDRFDQDLGGTEALPVDVPQGGGTVPRVIAFGKDGRAYLADRSDLGGIGGQAAIATVSTSAIITAPAIYVTPQRAMVAFQNNGSASCKGGSITMLSLTGDLGSGIQPAWCAALNGRGSPIITTSDGTSDPLVWAVGAEGDNLLHGFDAMTGATVFAGGGPIAGLHHFQTLIAWNGRLYVAGDGAVTAFTFGG